MLCQGFSLQVPSNKLILLNALFQLIIETDLAVVY